MVSNNQSYNNNDLLRQVWEVECNRYCGDCLKKLDLNNDTHVLLVPAVILVCGQCNEIHFGIASNKLKETGNSLNNSQQNAVTKGELNIT